MRNDIMHEKTDYETGITLRIVLDRYGDTESPLEYDDSVIMAILQNNKGNPAAKHGLTSPEAIAEFAKENADTWEEFPLYCYQHGAVDYSVSRNGNPYSCRFDSGRVGSIFVKLSAVSDPLLCAEQTCEVFTAWANGEVYGFTVEDSDGYTLDSVWGFIEPDGADGYVMSEGLAAFKYRVQESKQARAYNEAMRKAMGALPLTDNGSM